MPLPTANDRSLKSLRSMMGCSWFSSQKPRLIRADGGDHRQDDNEIARRTSRRAGPCRAQSAARRAPRPEVPSRCSRSAPVSFFCRFRYGGSLNQPRVSSKRQNADGHVDVKNPAPTVVVGDPAAERRADRRRQHHGHAIYRESHAAFLGRKGIRQDGLLAWLQSPAADALHHAEENQPAQRFGAGRTEMN